MTEIEVRAKVVAQAVSWLGKKESDGTHKSIIDLYNANTPLARGYAVTYTDAWCATFVSAVGIALGLTDIIPCECSCPQQVALVAALGKWQESDSYVPSAGDVMYYDWDDSGSGDCTGNPDHVGIVTGVTGTQITVIEGNISDAVGYRTMSVGGKYIRGYGCPDYASKATADYTEAVTAIQSLADKGIINSPDYWVSAVQGGTVQYLDSLMIQADSILKSSGTRTATPEDGIANLVAKGIINTPDHWLANYSKLQWLGDLICALGGAT